MTSSISFEPGAAPSVLPAGIDLGRTSFGPGCQVGGCGRNLLQPGQAVAHPLERVDRPLQPARPTTWQVDDGLGSEGFVDAVLHPLVVEDVGLMDTAPG